MRRRSRSRGRHRWEPWRELEGWRLYVGFWILFFVLIGWAALSHLLFD